jgi:putative polyhydroxyalkanoate system protein
MAHIVVTRLHSLDHATAQQAVDEVAERLRREFGVSTRREGEVVWVNGHGVSGRLEATHETLYVEATLGLRARPFQRLLRREIETELDRLAPLP